MDFCLRYLAASPGESVCLKEMFIQLLSEAFKPSLGIIRVPEVTVAHLLLGCGEALPGTCQEIQVILI